jgi:hypothetical protein
MVRNHQPGQAIFRSILPEDIDWKPFPAFPPSVRLALVVGRPFRFYLCLDRTCGAGQFKVRQLSASFGVFALAHLAWQSSFTPQMAVGEHSLQAQSFLEEPPFSSQ